MRKIKVLLWYWGRRGGGPNYALQMAKVLAEQPNIELHLSLSRQSEFYAQFAALNLPGFTLDTYSDRLTALLALIKLPAVRNQLRHYLVEHHIQVVYCPMDHLWNAAMLPVIKAHTQYLFTLHDATPHPGDNGGIGRFRQWLFSQDIRAADHIITLTKHVQTQLQQVYRYPASKSSVIPHGVFNYGSSSSRRTLPNREINLLFFGRILPYKGLSLLLAAFQRLKDEFPQLRLTIAGAGSLSAYAAALTDPHIQVDNRHIPEADIAEIFAQADLLVAPYREASQSGVVTIAMGAGVPVVATPVGGLKEQVIHQQTGLLTQAVSAEAIAEAIRQFILNPQLYEACSRQALQQVHRTMAWSTIGAQVTSIIQALATQADQ
ncbi:MAG: glycosyltransferase family 4 protein [Cyanophyceae cyanobacterium]